MVGLGGVNNIGLSAAAFGLGTLGAAAYYQQVSMDIGRAQTSPLTHTLLAPVRAHSCYNCSRQLRVQQPTTRLDLEQVLETVGLQNQYTTT